MTGSVQTYEIIEATDVLRRRLDHEDGPWPIDDLIEYVTVDHGLPLRVAKIAILRICSDSGDYQMKDLERVVRTNPASRRPGENPDERLTRPGAITDGEIIRNLRGERPALAPDASHGWRDTPYRQILAAYRLGFVQGRNEAAR